jgi:hypothetical protein
VADSSEQAVLEWTAVDESHNEVRVTLRRGDASAQWYVSAVDGAPVGQYHFGRTPALAMVAWSASVATGSGRAFVELLPAHVPARNWLLHSPLAKADYLSTEFTRLRRLRDVAAHFVTALHEESRLGLEADQAEKNAANDPERAKMLRGMAERAGAAVGVRLSDLAKAFGKLGLGEEPECGQCAALAREKGERIALIEEAAGAAVRRLAGVAVDVVGPSGARHYTRPADHPMVEDVKSAPAYAVRLQDHGAAIAAIRDAIHALAPAARGGTPSVPANAVEVAMASMRLWRAKLDRRAADGAVAAWDNLCEECPSDHPQFEEYKAALRRAKAAYRAAEEEIATARVFYHELMARWSLLDRGEAPSPASPPAAPPPAPPEPPAEGIPEVQLAGVEDAARCAAQGPWRVSGMGTIVDDVGNDVAMTLGRGAHDTARFIVRARDWVPRLVAEVRRLAAREAALSEALRPFAASADRHDESGVDSADSVYIFGRGPNLTVGNLRRARKALRGEGK